MKDINLPAVDDCIAVLVLLVNLSSSESPTRGITQGMSVRCQDLNSFGRIIPGPCGDPAAVM